jgi:LacI family transcriptional regulator
MNMRNDKVTIHDVAKAAGVSVSTVSRVLNDKDDVASTTQAHVQQIIDELGYASNLAARSMRSRQTNLLGLIMPDVADSYSIEVMKGVNQAIKANHYDLLIYTNGDIQKNALAAREQYYVSLLSSSLADGVIVVAPMASDFNTPAPLVVVDPNKQSPDYPAVIATNRDGAMSVMDYLISIGHQRIGFVGGRPEIQSATRRLQGYKDVLENAGIPLDQTLITIGDFSAETGRQYGHQLLALSPPPTAIFAANDQSAFGVIQAAHERGLKIPDDLSVAGFDNIPEAAYYLPEGLTTVDQSVFQMGLIATEMLVQLIKGEALEKRLRKMPTQLIVRGSCRSI